MSTLVIVSENSAMTIPVFDDNVTIACIGLEGRVGDQYQSLRDRGGVIFTNGLEPEFYLASKGLHFKLIIDGRTGNVYYDSYEGINHIPD